MILYYIIIFIIGAGTVLTWYFAPQIVAIFGNEVNQWFANVGITLLWITLFVKPLFIVLMQYTELKTLSFIWFWEYLKTIKGRSWKWLLYMLLSSVYFISGRGVKLRRLLWITTFVAIFTHAWLVIANFIHMSFPLANQLQNYSLLAGYIGILCLFFGYITSNDISLRFLKSHRKTIQYTSYIALIFAILHLMFLNPWEYFGHLILLIVYIVIKLIEKKYIVLK